MFDGIMDEIHISNVQRSAGWIATEFKNQSEPWIGGFYKEMVYE